ncbi:uncharacterized protein LOC120683005 [Panicum virgatum]|uniref:uncharacterized protein LOC120683005 n=1 Tax=Panicum virgatum TaxID=38727 RepID=UPI0019D61FFC|nr:uncharacterized protein LOC120683005 [Panicum virgatum]
MKSSVQVHAEELPEEMYADANAFPLIRRPSGVSIRHAVWQFLGPGSLAAPGFMRPTFDQAGSRAAELVRSAPSTSSKSEIMQQSRRSFLLGADEIRSHSRTERSSQPWRVALTAEHLRRRLVPGVGVHRPGDARHARRRLRPMVNADCRSDLRQPLGDGFFGTCVKACYAQAGGRRGRPVRRGWRRARHRDHPGRYPRVLGGA